MAMGKKLNWKEVFFMVIFVNLSVLTAAGL